MAKVDAALAGRPSPGRARGSSDLPAALAEAFRVLERTGNPGARGGRPDRRPARRPGGRARRGRWALVRDLRRRLPVPPRVWSVAFGAGAPSDAPERLGRPARRSRGPWSRPACRSTVTADAGQRRPRAADPDGRAARRRPRRRRARRRWSGRSRAGGRAPLVVPDDAADPGLAPADRPARRRRRRPAGRRRGVGRRRGRRGPARPAGRRRARPASRSAARPTSSAPRSPRPATTRRRSAPTVVTPDRLTAAALQGQSVVVLANVERLDAGPGGGRRRGSSTAGGGVLVAPGDRADPAAYARPALDAREARRPDGRLRRAEGRGAPRAGDVHRAGPAPVRARATRRRWPGPTSSPTAGSNPRPGASVSARLDTGDPWAVERAAAGKGRVLLLAGAARRRGGDPAGQPRLRPARPRVGLPPRRRRRAPRGPARRADRLRPRPRAAAGRHDAAGPTPGGRDRPRPR